MPTSDFSDLIRARHSVRDFRTEPIPASVIDGVLDDARHAPSWSNTRAYQVAVATGERLERLRAAYVAEFDASSGLRHRLPAALLRAAVLRKGLPDGDFKIWKPYPADLRPRSVKIGVGLYQHLGIARGDQAAREAHARRNCEFFGAPAVIWVFAHASLLPFSAQDAGLMLQTLMLSAKSRGVDSCPLGVLAAWRRPVDAEFVVDPSYRLLTGVALGYASDAPVNEFRAEHPPLSLVPVR